MPRNLVEFCSQFGLPVPKHVRIGKRYFYDPLKLAAMGASWDVFSVGIFLGEERREFSPTSALIDILGRQSDKRVVVNENATWLFLCGRDILMDGVILPGQFDRDEIVFVSDGEDILGFGKIVSRYDRSMHNRIYVKHRLDKGEYLRRER